MEPLRIIDYPVDEYVKINGRKYSYDLLVAVSSEKTVRIEQDDDGILRPAKEYWEARG